MKPDFNYQDTHPYFTACGMRGCRRCRKVWYEVKREAVVQTASLPPLISACHIVGKRDITLSLTETFVSDEGVFDEQCCVVLSLARGDIHDTFLDFSIMRSNQEKFNFYVAHGVTLRKGRKTVDWLMSTDESQGATPIDFNEAKCFSLAERVESFLLGFDLFLAMPDESKLRFGHHYYGRPEIVASYNPLIFELIDLRPHDVKR